MHLGQFKSALKFFIKQRVVGSVRDILLFFVHTRPNMAGWENRLLVINFNALGDAVMSTSVLKHYKDQFPGKKISLLVRAHWGITEDIFGSFVHEIITVDHIRFGINPFYAVSVINRLRNIGFYEVIDQGPSVTELAAKVISVSIGAKEIYGYEGLGMQLRNQYTYILRDSVRIARKKFSPRYTRLIPSIDKEGNPPGRLHHMIRHFAAIYEGIGGTPGDYSTSVPVDPKAEQTVLEILDREGISPRTYCALTLGSTAPSRRWEIKKFVEIAKELDRLHVPIILVGSKDEIPLGEEFMRAYDGTAHNIIGKLSSAELIALIDQSLFVFTNETAPVHIAVARKTPMFCVSGVGHLGMPSLYGYKTINVWVYDNNAPCLCDFGACELTVPPGSPAPCLASLTPEAVLKELHKLLDTIRDPNGLRREHLAGNFEVEFQDLSRSS